MALEYIQSHFDQSGLVIQDAAKGLRVTRWHLSRILRRALKCAFRDLIAVARFKAALPLLEHPELSIKEVAAMVGFRDTAEFDRKFRARFGLTPTQHRRQRPDAQARKAEVIKHHELDCVD
jgi:AraC-like DNA-binding protein